MGRTRSSTPPAISEAVRQAYHEHCTKGTPIAALTAMAGVKRSKLRRLFYHIAGTRDAFKAARAALRPTPIRREGEPVADGDMLRAERRQQRAERRRQKAEHARPIDIDDSKLPFIWSAKRIDGWGFEERYDGAGLQYIVAHSPEGHAYVRARPTEKADLLYLSNTEGIPNVRLKRLDQSRLEQRAAVARETAERRRRANADRRVHKRRARLARKRRPSD